MTRAQHRVLGSTALGLFLGAAGGVFVYSYFPIPVLPGLLIADFLHLADTSWGCSGPTPRQAIPVFMANVVAFGGAGAGIAGLSFLVVPARRDEQCAECGYDLTGNKSGRCPECGSTIPADQLVHKANEGTEHRAG